MQKVLLFLSWFVLIVLTMMKDGFCDTAMLTSGPEGVGVS